MDLLLKRTYFKEGCNGTLFVFGKVVCHSIELPWKDNQKGISCIPEGTYRLGKRYSQKFGWHMEVLGVEGRSLILFHPANNALNELRGCIAPVTKVSGAGLGLQSRKAFEKLKKLVYDALAKKEEVYLIIQS